MGAVILLVRLAELTLQACLNLCTHTNAVTNLDGRHLVADLDGLADDFVADADWKGAFSPPASNCVDI